MTNHTLLPPQFVDLEPYARVWGLIEDSDERFLQRQRSTQTEIKAFYSDMSPRLEEVFSYLDRWGPEDSLAPAEKALYLTALGLAEISLNEELFAGAFPHLPRDYGIRIQWVDYPVTAIDNFSSFLAEN